MNEKEELVIPKIGLLVSNKCNLCCKGCNHLIDLKEPGDNLEFTADELLGDLEKIVEVVDLINHVVVVGGEAFLHPDLYEILRRILDLPKIGYVLVITSGSVKPRDPRLFELMENKRVIVEISGYGEELPKRIKVHVDNFMAELKRHNVQHYYFGTLQWFDFGDFSHRPYSREQHHEVYTTCCSVSNDIFNGRLYKCSRAAVGTHQGRISDHPEDYVDLRKYSGNKLRDRLVEYLGNEYPLACLQCNGASIVIDAGIQVPRLMNIQRSR